MNTENLEQAQITKLHEKIKQSHWKYKKDHWMYCFFYYLCTYGSAALSAAAASVIQISAIPDPKRGYLASVRAGIATVLITVSAIGNFHANLLANRAARYKLEQLLNRIEFDHQPDVAKYVSDLNNIIGHWPLGS